MAKFFSLGQVVATPGALALLDKHGKSPAEFLARHSENDWGNVPACDSSENDLALENGDRIVSSYNLRADGSEKVWVITEWDRSVTTVLLPSEY